MKVILVTGGLGVVGIGLVRELKERGHTVYSCDLNHDSQECGFSISGQPNVGSYMRCDVGEFRQCERLFNRIGSVDLVYHAAAEFGRWNGEDFYENLWRTNVVGTKNILRLQEERRFRLVHFSSSEVYGNLTETMHESAMDKYPIHQMNDYAMSKWVNEMQVHNSTKQFKTESVIVRLFNTYGPGEYYSPYRSVNCRFLYCALNGLPWIVRKGHTRTSTFLPDTVKTLANITDNFKLGETYNIGGNGEHTIEELSNAVICATGADPSLAKLTESEPMTTTFKRVDCSKSILDLKHSNTVTLDEGLRLTATWMRQVYNLKVK